MTEVFCIIIDHLEPRVDCTTVGRRVRVDNVIRADETMIIVEHRRRTTRCNNELLMSTDQYAPISRHMHEIS